MLSVYIGYDSREPVAYSVAAHSLLRRAHRPVSVAPLARHQLANVFWRLRKPTEATEFSISRFLVPFLSGYEGLSVYMDCDVVVRADINDLWDMIYADERAFTVSRHCPDPLVWVVKHDYVPSTETKMDGIPQSQYPRKNWSSVMVFNNERCRQLTPDYVNIAPASELHQFGWCKDEQVAELPREWNWLVGEYPHNDQAKILHYTLGGPWFPEHLATDHAIDWWDEYNDLRAPL